MCFYSSKAIIINIRMNKTTSPCMPNKYSYHRWVGDSVVDDRVDRDGDGVSGQNLLGRHVECDGSEVHLQIDVTAMYVKGNVDIM